ncbi:MAG: prolipoprotein diacylglyceryl transferase [Nocardioidaceae bacterium]
MILASIPSPSQGVWQLGPFPIRAYALCIILGVVAAVWIGDLRWRARGGQPGTVADVAVWAVPFGLVGGRLYHVITDWQLYFSDGAHPIRALYVWEGGLGIWGAISLGALGAWIGCRRRGVPFLRYADAVAPGVAVAQAIGRWGNWFNQELFGKPTSLPWGLHIDPINRPLGFERFTTFQPTFLYESLWDLGVAGLVIWADRRFRLGHGRALALYVMAYTAGRAWIEYLRIDPVNHIGPLRLNDWTALVVFLAALLFFIYSARRHPGREEYSEPPYDGAHSTDDDLDEDEPDDADDTVADEETAMADIEAAAAEEATGQTGRPPGEGDPVR